MVSPVLLEPRVTPPRPLTEEALYEVVNGQRVELPPMSTYATWVTSRLDQRLGPFVEEGRLGTVVTEALFILDRERNLRRRPDVAFVSTERWPLERLIPEAGDWEVVPDLAVEVVSPSDTMEEVLAKMHEYFEKGVRQVWIVVPMRQQVHGFDSPTRRASWRQLTNWTAGSCCPASDCRWPACSSARAKLERRPPANLAKTRIAHALRISNSKEFALSLLPHRIYSGTSRFHGRRPTRSVAPKSANRGKANRSHGATPHARLP